jgi:nitrogen fixation NifU-like protein
LIAMAWDDLQQKIENEMRGVYSETAIDHAMNPRNIGSIENADGHARLTGPCGDTMEIWLKVCNGIIANACFMTDGCGSAIAAGSMVTELAKSKTTYEVFRISQQYVLEALGGLPEESQHCALLAANTLKNSLKNYLVTRNEKRKQAYR